MSVEYDENCCFNDIRDLCVRERSGNCPCPCHKAVEVTLHGKYAQGPMPVEFRDAFVALVEAVVKGLEDGTIPTRRRAQRQPAAEGE